MLLRWPLPLLVLVTITVFSATCACGGPPSSSRLPAKWLVILLGPAFEERGTALGVRFVDDACRLFGSNGLGIESMVNITTNSMEKAGVDPDNIQKFIQALKDDYQKMSNDQQQNFRTNPVDRAYQVSLSRIARTDIEKLVEAAEERRDQLQVAHAPAQAAEGHAQAAEGHAQAAEDHAQAAEGRAQAAEGRAQAEANLRAAAEGRAQAAEGRAQAEAERMLEVEAKLRAIEVRCLKHCSSVLSNITSFDLRH